MFFFLLVLRTTSSPHIQFPGKKYSSIASENKKGVMTLFPLKIAPSIVLFLQTILQTQRTQIHIITGMMPLIMDSKKSIKKIESRDIEFAK